MKDSRMFMSTLSTSSPKKKRTGLWVAASVLIVIVAAASLFHFNIIPWPFKPQEEAEGEVAITSSRPTEVTTQSVDYSGGTVEVTDSSSPLHGLKIEIPEMATDETITFTVSYSDILDIKGLPENASVASKLIKIETSGSETWNQFKIFDTPVIVTLPYDSSLVSTNELVRFYYYDNQSNVLDSAGFLYETPTNHTITFYTGSFSELVGFRLYLYYGTTSLFGEYTADTGFRPKSDGWFMANYGSYLNPFGNCMGMITYARWFYRTKSVTQWLHGAWVATGDDLYKKYREGDPNQWRDDATAIQLATRAQIAMGDPFKAVLREKKYLTTDVTSTNMYHSRRVALTWLHGMLVTHQPQIVGLATQFVNGKISGGGHMVIAYRYANGRFDIYDPNYPATNPGTDVRQIPYTWDEGMKRAYGSETISGANARAFNIFLALSSKVFGSRSFYAGLYDAAEKKFKDDTVFPTVKFTSASTVPEGTTPEDTDGDGIRDTKNSTVTISGTISGGKVEGKVGDGWIFVSGQELPVPVVGEFPKYTFSVKVPLFQGDNEVIFLASFDKHRYWAGYLKETIKCTASKATFTVTMWWNQADSDVDLHVLEPTIEGREGRHIYYSNPGGEAGYPYLDIDDTDGKGPEHYYATEDMTLPNYQGPEKSLYGTYKVRVHYYADHDEDEEERQHITWHLKVRYLAFRISATNDEDWEEETKSGRLKVESTGDTSNFNNADASWSAIWPMEYPEPDPAKYEIPPPPQNKFPD